MIINCLGAVLLGLVSGINLENHLYLLIADGFLGAFTTFSTFMYEGFNLFKDNERKNAITYVAGTMIIGSIGFLAGFSMTKLF